jgi:hypothetical protein
MPVCFAKEILQLWKQFENALDKSTKAEDQELKELARKKRKEAIDAAEFVVNSTVAQHHASLKGQALRPKFVFE